MLIIVGVVLTLLTPLVVLGLGYLRVRHRYQLLITPLTTLIALVLVFTNLEIIPITIPLLNLSPAANVLGPISLLVDKISWPFVIAILTLILATFLVDIAHLENLSPYSWAFIQFLGGLGIMAVLSGNPLTILFAWSVIDITECIALLRNVPSSRDREKVVISLSVRITGIVLVISSVIIAQGMEIPLSFDEVPNQVSVILILAAGLRLVALPFNQLHLKDQNKFRNAEITIRFISSVAGIVIGVRAAESGITGDWFLIIIVLLTAVVTLNALFWINAKNEIQGISYWIFGYGSFSLAAAAQGIQSASLAWALAMVFSGALFFKIIHRNRGINLLVYLGGIGISALPLIPTWEGSVQIYSLPWFSRIIFLFIQALMIVGYIRITTQSTHKDHGIEKWALVIYSIGLTILPMMHYGVFYFMWISGLNYISFQSAGWWSGIISTGISIILIIRYRGKFVLLHNYVSRINTILLWISRFLWWGYRLLGRILFFVTRIFEGDGSLLWAILILILLTVTIRIWGSGDIFEL
jgi:hypothetical protein